MKKKILLLMGIFSLGVLNAQVGINTLNPQGMLHIDSKGDTQSNGTNSSDDVIVTNDGRLGINTIKPDALLHLETNGTPSNPIPAFRLEDGNQGSNKILSIINNNGLATWQTLTVFDAVYYNKPSTCPNLPISTPNYYFTNATINLAPGRWVVMIVMYLSADGVASHPDTRLCWVNSTLADDSTIANNGQTNINNIASPDIQGSKSVSGMIWTKDSGGTLSGSLVINNTSSQTKKYYYMMGETNTYDIVENYDFKRPGGSWGEDSIVAFRIPSDI